MKRWLFACLCIIAGFSCVLLAAHTIASAADAITRTGIGTVPPNSITSPFDSGCGTSDSGQTITFCNTFKTGFNSDKILNGNCYASSTASAFGGSSEGCIVPSLSWVEGGVLHQIPQYNPTDACQSQWSPTPNGPPQYFEADDSGLWLPVSSNPTNIAAVQSRYLICGNGGCVFHFQFKTGNIANLDNPIILYSSVLFNRNLFFYAWQWEAGFDRPGAPLPDYYETDISPGIINFYKNSVLYGAINYGSSIPSSCNVSTALCDFNIVIVPGVSISAWVNDVSVGSIYSGFIPNTQWFVFAGTPVTRPGTNYPDLIEQWLGDMSSCDCLSSGCIPHC